MPDYGQRLEFGCFLWPDADDPAGVLATARLIDELGYDLVGIQDHPYQPRHLDSLSLLAVILGQTGRLRAFHSVANLALRPPARLAKAVASLAGGGRLLLWPGHRPVPGGGGPAGRPRRKARGKHPEPTPGHRSNCST